MTDSVDLSIRLLSLSSKSRSMIQFRTKTETDNDGVLVRRYPAPFKERTPSGAQMKLLPRLGQDGVPVAIDVDLNVPNALVGQNYEHGTSVFAAGRAGLRLVRNVLASQGLPRKELDLLCAKDVSFRGVTLTVLLPQECKEEAQWLVSALSQHVRLFNAKAIIYDSTNLSVYVPERMTSFVAYHKTSEKHFAWPASAPIDELREQGQKIVRLEFKLGEPFLRKKGLVALPSWRTAYAEGLYETLYKEVVLGRLGLNLRRKRPRAEVWDRLTPTERALLEWYFAGRDPARFKFVAGSANPVSRLSALRMSILKKARICIDLPWEQHQSLNSQRLLRALSYPGDYHPAPDREGFCFCRKNWPALQAELDQLYEEALRKGAAVRASLPSHGR